MDLIFALFYWATSIWRRLWCYITALLCKDANNIPKYQHTAIKQRRTFRILHLEPLRVQKNTKNDLEEELYGRITRQNLDSCDDPYDALSYCWQNSDNNVSSSHRCLRSIQRNRLLIRMEDGSLRRMSISAELSTALRYLRAHGQTRPLFVDQVCIDQGDNNLDSEEEDNNQENSGLKLGLKNKKLRKRRKEALLEKSQQIGLMGDIYRKCVRVVAWLGESTAETNVLFDFVSRISRDEALKAITVDQYRMLLVRGEESAKKIDRSIIEQDIADIKKLREAHWSDFPHRGYLELCVRRWFRRIWIIQEMCLAPDVMILCGRKTCSIQELEMLYVFGQVAASLDPPWKSKSIEDIPWYINWWWCWIDLTLLWYGSFKNRNNITHEAMMASHLVFRMFQKRRHMKTLLLQSTESEAEYKALQLRLRFPNTVISFNMDEHGHGSWTRFKASNPRDYLYGLKGLAPRDDDVAIAFTPDYRKSTCEIYTDFTSRLINPVIELLLLSRPESKILSGLPSWVPDWSSDLVLPHGFKVGAFAIFSAGQRSDKTLNPRCRMMSPDILSIKSVFLGTVDEIGACIMELPPGEGKSYSGGGWTSPVYSTVIPFLREVREFCQKPAAFSYDHNVRSALEIEEAIWLTSTGGHGLSQAHGLPKAMKGDALGPIEDGKPLLGRLWDLFLRMDTLCTIREERRNSLKDIGIGPAVAEATNCGVRRREQLKASISSLVCYLWQRLLIEALALHRYYTYFVVWPFSSASGRRFLYQAIFKRSDRHLPIALFIYALKRHIGRRCFISKTGHVGLVPRHAQAGDLVVVPVGGSCPIVLRPTQDNLYLYVGEGYCYGFMHGEAVANKKITKYKWYNIR